MSSIDARLEHIREYNVERYQYDEELRRMPQTVKFTKTIPTAQMPRQSYEGDAGYDLYTAVETEIPSGEWRDIPVGIAIEPPHGYWVRLVGRSSTFRRRGLLVIEGVVDNGYRGDIYFGVWNSTGVPVVVGMGERIAQAIIHRVCEFEWEEVDELADSRRQGAGFGSTGT